MRIDQYLLKHGGARSRSQAQEWIRLGYVEILQGGQWIQITKSSYMVDEANLSFRLSRPEGLDLFVSRAGEKLSGALRHLDLSVAGLRVLDIGSSTGGFMDCLLKAGASEVVGVDVGHGQLAEELRGHPGVHNFEGLNARDLKPEDLKPLEAREAFDLIVMDVSFISVELILPRIPVFLKPGGLLLSLIKPQFELGAQALDKRGVVKDPSLYPALEKKIFDACTALGFDVMDYFDSVPKGRDGNQEYFVYARR